MVLELAEINVKPGAESAFELAVTQAQPLFAASQGCHGMQLHRSVEVPARYFLMVKWETLEDHTVTFRGSQAFARWRELASPHFSGAPQVQHLDLVVG